MKTWKKVALLLSASCAYLPAIAQSQLDVGGAIGYSQYVYKDYKHLVLPIPMVSYDSNTFYFRGISAGYHLWQDDKQSLSLDLAYSPRSFDPDDTGDAQLKLLHKRHSTMLIGALYEFRLPAGKFSTSVHVDALNETNGGVLANISYSYPVPLSPQLFIAPAVGIDWQNAHFNQYYYGVSNSEAVSSELSPYKASAGISPYADVALRYQIDKQLSAMLALRYTRLSSEISDSPMAGRKGIYSTFLSVTYRY